MPVKLIQNKTVSVKILENYDHILLKENPDGKIYSVKISDEVLTIITNWILNDI
jgi:hypothetical protein